MNSLHPTVWRTCRVIANETRLKLLWRLFQLEDSCMGQLARSVGVKEPAASSGLRALSARGLIGSERRGLYVFYKPEVNAEVEHAELVLTALRRCYDDIVPFKQVIHQATAFTHPRRIEIVRALEKGALDDLELSFKTQISIPALHRHLRKLRARGFIIKKNGKLTLQVPSDQLAAALLTAALD